MEEPAKVEVTCPPFVARWPAIVYEVGQPLIEQWWDTFCRARAPLLRTHELIKGRSVVGGYTRMLAVQSVGHYARAQLCADGSCHYPITQEAPSCLGGDSSSGWPATCPAWQCTPRANAAYLVSLMMGPDYQPASLSQMLCISQRVAGRVFVSRDLALSIVPQYTHDVGQAVASAWHGCMVRPCR
jgi:hypothetical protein